MLFATLGGLGYSIYIETTSTKVATVDGTVADKREETSTTYIQVGKTMVPSTHTDYCVDVTTEDYGNKEFVDYDLYKGVTEGDKVEIDVYRTKTGSTQLRLAKES